MSSNQYPNELQFAGLIQAATAAADAQERNAQILGKRQREQDDSLIDTQLRAPPDPTVSANGQLPPTTPTLHSSATVLFREPSEASKKYSRPPLGKVYTDLQMAPETFLRLQNAAKSYMLDEDHMERRDVVGHKKHSAQNDVAKLRLWACVEDFLSRDNSGERWFGHSAGVGIPDTPQRTFFWPEDREKIVKLCMPLFRKMVTNERQRIYASETRKQDTNKGDKNRSGADTTLHPVNATLPSQTRANDPIIIDDALDVPDGIQLTYTANDEHQTASSTDHVTLHVNIVSNDNGTYRRLVPRFSVLSNAFPNLPALIAEARKKYELAQTNTASSGDDWFIPAVKVWLPDGLLSIKEDGQWVMAILSASMVDWMDSELKVLIELGSTQEVITV